MKKPKRRKYNMNADSFEMREKAARICRDYLHGAWKTITARDIQLKRISGGLSNWLYHVSLPSDMPRGTEPSQVLLRLYGQTHGDRALEALITESVIFTLLSERRLGPKLHGVFPGGRIEEYIPARPLRTNELSDPKLSVLIAERMAQIHRMNIPISKEPNWLWDTMQRWLQNVEGTFSNIPNNKYDNKFMEKIHNYNLSEEVQWLKSFLKNVNSPVVFCHNDMQEGNILLHSQNLTEQQALVKPQLILIDFEYCSYNYRGFDLANHFVEWIYDYTNPEHPYFSASYHNYPSNEQQLEFVRAYLRTTCQKPASVEEELKLLSEVQAFTLASHIFWGLWSIVNAKLSQIPFGYWEYAAERIGAYFYTKNQLINIPTGAQIKNELQDLEV